MSNVVEMKSVQSLDIAVNLDEDLKAEILECKKRIEHDKVPLRKLAMCIGRDGAFIESLAERGSWQFLGYKDQHDFRIAQGICRSNWYRHVGVASHFLKVDRPYYLAMTMENAERLAVEPEEVRFDPDKLAKAATMTARTFDDLLTQEGAHREGKPRHERWVQVRYRMKEEQRRVIENALTAWKEEHGIADDAYALELLAVEYMDRPTLVGFLLRSRQELTEKIRSVEDVAQLKLLLADYLIEMGGVLESCCGAVEEEEIA